MKLQVSPFDVRHIKRFRCIGCACLLIFAVMDTVAGQGRLIWQDEFDGPAGASPEPAKWTYDLGAGVGETRNWRHTRIRA